MPRLMLPVIVITLLFACVPPVFAASQFVLQPLCNTAAERRLSTSALILALQSKRWIIRGADLNAGQVEARNCRGRTCYTVNAWIDAKGTVAITGKRRQANSEVSSRPPRNWIRHLKHAYQGYTCYEPEAIEELRSAHHYPPYRDLPPAQ